MRVPLSTAALVLAALLPKAWGQTTACKTSAAAWQNAPFAAQSAAFNVTFQAKPNNANMDGITGLSLGPASGYSGLATVVRFNNAGRIDARNGGVYAASTVVPYSPGGVYRFRLTVNPATRRYSVFVAPPGLSERTLASNYAFRSEQASVSSLNNLAVQAGLGTHEVCGFAIGGGGTADTTAPNVSIQSPANNAAVTGSIIARGSASDNAGVASVQVAVDGGAYAPAIGASNWSYSLNTVGLSNGPHTINAKAQDAAGNSKIASITVNVSNLAPGCLLSAAGWKNTPIPSQSAAFDALFEATPNTARMDGLTGLSLGAASAYSQLATTVRFNNMGTIDARNGNVYAAETPIVYTPGFKYRVRMAVNLPARRYSVYVTPPGSSEKTLATNYAFRGEQSATASLNSWAVQAGAGSHQVCAFTIAAPAADTTAPSVALTAPTNAAVLSGAATVSAAASDNVGVAGVQFKLDGANLGPEDTTAPYSTSWNTATAANGPHALTAVARDAAHNQKTAASVGVTVNNGVVGGGDRFGVRKLYAGSGKEWVSNWDNGVVRTINSGGYDPSDPWLRARGNGTHKIDGRGLLKMSGSDPRLYIVDPAASSWRNVEVTVYVLRVSDLNGSGGIVGVARTNHTSPDANLCDSRGIGARFHYTGNADFHKETAHHQSESVKSLSTKTLFSGGMPYNRWIGYKFVVYDLADGNVKLESWLDSNESGNWVKVNEFVDNGSNFGVGGSACKPGIDPALRLTNSDARPGTETGKPNLAVYFRSTGVNTDGLVYKKMSVRTIIAP